ncbi:60S ribosomal protein L7a [Microtus ochrogaster]|uniref:60S ribosomal protein L7a n=1 Tax=Microtus ochrogaster TaxID=79684 RepID=A0A8J6KSS8_MICOH|nr:60S ribosomal protein L7a [Microtus ochrogaster]
MATQLLKFAHKYRLQTNQKKKLRLLAHAWKKAAGNQETTSPSSKGQYSHHFGGEQVGSAGLIAYCAELIELMKFLPGPCHKMGVPYCIVKGKVRLGRLVHGKTGTTVAFTQVDSEDKDALAKLIEAIGI